MVNVATFNVRGIGDTNKRATVFKFLKNKLFEVIMLQETHSVKRCEKIWKSQWRGQIMFAHGASNARGVAIFIKKGCKTKIHKTIMCKDGRFLIVDIDIDDERYTLCNVYAPNTDSPEFFSSIFQQIDKLDNDNIIIGGDFNTTLSSKDRRGKKIEHINSKSTKVINDYMSLKGILDIWRNRHPDDFKSTWCKSKPYVLLERLDYLLISYKLSMQVTIADIDPSFMSDHSIPYIWCAVGVSDYGYGYWKLNIDLLEDKVFIDECKVLISKISEEIVDVKLRWEMIKLETRGIAIKHMARKKKSNSNKLTVLFKKELDLIEKIEKGDNSLFTDNEQQLTLVKKDIQEIFEQKTKKSMLTNAINWFQAGEKSSKYFFALEKSHTKKPLVSIKIHDTVINDSEHILEQLNKFYSKLYRSAQKDISTDYLDNIQIPQISEAEKLVLDEPLNTEEIEIAIRQMKLKKCPGLDGLPIEFYLVFWDSIKYTLHSLFLKCIKDGEMHATAKEGIISLLEKPGKDLLKIENWRPLSLLCCDYKIFAKVISNRISLIINDIIHEDQAGFIKGRYIADNLMDINCIINETNRLNEEYALISVYFQKAYDKVERQSLMLVLRKFNFGNQIIHMIETCMSKNVATVINNGTFKEFFDVTRGLRQGDPQSCYLFNLIIEILAIKIRNNEKIEGIQIGDKYKKLGQYADDMWNIIKHKDSCYSALFLEFKLFQLFCRLKINYDKTEILRLGSLRNTDAEYYSGLPIKWSDGPVKILGIYVFPDLDVMSEYNYLETIQKICNICKIWSYRSLSLLGKILVVNTLVISLFIYRLQVLSSPSQDILKRYKDIITEFLWEHKRPKIAYNRLITSYEQGGLQLQDLKLKDQALKCKCILSKTSENTLFTQLLYKYLPITCDRLIECNF